MVEKLQSEAMPIRYPDFAERLQKAMAESDISVTDIKTRLNVTYEMARRYSLGYAMPRLEKLAALAEIVKTTPSFLQYGRDSFVDEGLSVTPARRSTDKAVPGDLPGMVSIPKVEFKLQAGIHNVPIEPLQGEGSTISMPKRIIAQRGYNLKALVAIDVRGQSMEPSLYEGDTVVINRDDKEPRDGDVYAINYDGEAIIKRLQRDIGFWWLTSDNTDERRYPKKKCDGEMCLIIGKVVWKQSERI